MENRIKDQGMIAWSETVTENTEATIAFYKNVFGYEHEDMQTASGGTYIVLKVPNHTYPIMGILKPSGDAADVPKHYFVVDNVDETEKKALALGGSVVKSAFDRPPMCRTAILKDDQDYIFGVASFFDDAIKKFDPSVDNAGRTQGIIGWFDILSQDIDEALNFYTGLFGYTPQETPNAPQRYVILGSEQAKIDGFGAVTQMPEAAKHLGTRYIKKYISVDDLEKTNEAVKANGGTILVEKIDVPQAGSFSIFTDNNGDILSAIHYIN